MNSPHIPNGYAPGAPVDIHSGLQLRQDDLTKLRGLRIAVIGGGIAGVSAAWRLRRQLGESARIFICEAYDRLGGKLKTVDFVGGPVDMGAEAYLSLRSDFTDLVRDVGLEHALEEPSGLPSGLFAEGALVDIPRTTLMGIPHEGASIAHIVGEDQARRVDEEKSGQPMTWSPEQDTTVGQLVEARFGRTVVDRLVSPLLGGVYSCTAYDLGVRATMPDLAAKLDELGEGGRAFFLSDAVGQILDGRRKRSNGSGAVFKSFNCGYRGLVDAMVKQANPEVFLNTGVESIGRTRNGWYVEPLGEFDALVIATPAPTAAVLLEHMVPTAAEVLHSVELASSVVVGMRMASAHGIPERSGVLLGADAPTDAKAFTFSSRKWPHLGERGGAFVRASFGTFSQPWYLETDDRALLTYAIDDLAKVTGERKRPEEFFVQRWWGGIPRYGVGYRESMAVAYKEVQRTRGIALAGSMLDGVGVPAAAATGIRAADEILQEML
ncbi:protoporphyrinogen oxidase [Corynebacterium auriscanis]|uniref:protoporphyrinogen oxidase n=1 Tax=Corynebacterium auriscanis TaxID=99807 RepID=UPI000A063695|nr:protoporphyrinogen oxidase [Corynebacterium auriscanis]MCX2162948.1 protoporphyrinogen oxidase [Corynebacterium auriscanis]WJY72808.1 Protoporphyrinogen oxidase [Corynebacterium auriscanis]